MSNKADLVNKGKQSKLEKFINTKPKSSAKRDQPASSPDVFSPSWQQVEKQAKLNEFETSPMLSTFLQNPLKMKQYLYYKKCYVLH